MELTVKIRNISTGALTDIPHSLWKEKQNTPEFRGVFERVKVKLPPEVVALKAQKAADQKKMEARKQLFVYGSSLDSPKNI